MRLLPLKEFKLCHVLLENLQRETFFFFSTIQNLSGPISIFFGVEEAELRASLQDAPGFLVNFKDTKIPECITVELQSYELGNSVGVRSS